MSDTPPSVHPSGAAESSEVGDTVASPLTPANIETVLTNYREWLTQLTALPEQYDDSPPVDLHTLVSQFTALRHEVNLQTKSARTAVEQNATTLEQLSKALDTLAKPSTDATKPLLKAIVDGYDALALALRQVTKQREAIVQAHDDVLTGIVIPEPPAVPEAVTPTLVEQPRGFWSRLFGSKPAIPMQPDIATAVGRQLMLDWQAGVQKEAEARQQRQSDAVKHARTVLEGLLAGYQMSLNRLDRALEQAGLRPIPTQGQAFDPELMEAVEVVADSGQKAGTVVEELRRGYTRDGVVFRFAQVKVAR